MNWDLEGQHLNIGQDGEFIVAMGGGPLPHSDAILLATFQLLVAEPYPNIVILGAGTDPECLGARSDGVGALARPEHAHPPAAIHRRQRVAGINWGPPVGIGRPAPLATLTGGSVELQWPAPDDPGEGCHLYRRDDTGADLRLTDQPAGRLRIHPVFHRPSHRICPGHGSVLQLLCGHRTGSKATAARKRKSGSQASTGPDAPAAQRAESLQSADGDPVRTGKTAAGPGVPSTMSPDAW